MIVIELVVAITTVVFAVLPAKGMIRRNAFIGIRTRATMRDAAVWQIGHRAAVLPTTIAASITIVAGLVSIAAGRMNDPLSVVACAVPVVIGALWSVVAAGRAIR